MAANKGTYVYLSSKYNSEVYKHNSIVSFSNQLSSFLRVSKNSRVALLESFIPMKTYFNVERIFVHIDLVDDILFGDKNDTVVRIISTMDPNKLYDLHSIFPTPYYFPLKKQIIQKISVRLTDENGETLELINPPRPEYNTVLLLHFT